VPLVLIDEDDGFSAFHVRHGFMIFIVTIVGNVFFSIVDVAVNGWASLTLGRAFNVAIVVASLYGLVSALRGKERKIWGISDLLEMFPI